MNLLRPACLDGKGFWGWLKSMSWFLTAGWILYLVTFLFLAFPFVALLAIASVVTAWDANPSFSRAAAALLLGWGFGLTRWRFWKWYLGLPGIAHLLNVSGR